MMSYRITCFTKENHSGKPHDATHMILVGIEAAQNNYHDMKELKDILRLIDEGHSFYTESLSTGRRASVHTYDCKTCGRTTIRSAADSIQDNNLENLPGCRF